MNQLEMLAKINKQHALLTDALKEINQLPATAPMKGFLETIQSRAQFIAKDALKLRGDI